jgi:phenylalanyl-tRNA synthetase beta chain
VRSALPDLLREVVLFDVYVGERIDPGRKSVALGLILQASSQTLTDDAVEAAVTAVLDRLQSELGARLRD